MTMIPAFALPLLLGASQGMGDEAEDRRPPGGRFTLWQLPNQTPTQIMSYVIRTSGGAVIAIDGGMPGDAAYLRGFIAALGNRADAWIITHAHRDHFGALEVILPEPRDLRIGPIYSSMPDDAWMEAHGNREEQRDFRGFVDALDKAHRTVTELALGQELDFDGTRFEVLGIKNLELTANAVNESSIVLRVSDEAKSVLFTGDLGVQGGEKVMAGPYADRLHVDYLQMAHHGQNGCDEAFYRYVNPRYCLWPTPDWLWHNDNGGGEGSGPWRTLEVRAWMEKLPIRRHYLMFEGLCEIE